LSKEIFAGTVVNYYRAIGVASVKVTDYLEVGNLIHIKGHTTDFEQVIESIQLNHKPITKALKGQLVGIKVKEYIRKRDSVYRIEK
jgi:putative protease